MTTLQKTRLSQIFVNSVELTNRPHRIGEPLTLNVFIGRLHEIPQRGPMVPRFTAGQVVRETCHYSFVLGQTLKPFRTPGYTKHIEGSS
jgi:hypothetical protein